ncbi:MAG: tetratricopeptide repeat protein [Candidatus Omnitrophota bacterium]
MYRYKIPAVLFILIVITFVSLYPCLCNGFTLWDDNRFIAENKLVRDISPRNIKTMFTSAVCENYAPLAMLSYAVEYRIAGTDDPFIYHADNLILHLANCLLVFWFIYLISGSAAVSFITALFFGIHPMHVESVAWISERRDVLYSFFFMLSLIFYIRYLRGAKKAVDYSVSVSMFIFSMLSKTMAITLPALLFVMDYFTRRKVDRKAFLDKIPYFIIACIFGAAGYLAQQSLGKAAHLDHGLLNNTAFAVYGLVFYLKKLIFPVGLSAFYPYPSDVPSAVRDILLYSLPALAAVTAAVTFSARYTRKAAFGSLFFLVVLLPVIKVIPLGRAVAADRYVYIAYIGLFYVLAEAVCRFCRVKNTAVKISVVVLAAAAIFVLSALSSQRCRVWKDNISLWTDAVRNYPSVEAYIGRGVAYANIGRFDEAAKEYDKAAGIDVYSSDIYTNRGNIYFKAGNFSKAIDDYSFAIKLNSVSYKSYYNRGIVYIKMGQLDKAIEDFNEAIEINPKCTEAYGNRGACLGNLGREEEALRDFKKAVEIDPEYLPARDNMDKMLKNSACGS